MNPVVTMTDLAITAGWGDPVRLKPILDRIPIGHVAGINRLLILIMCGSRGGDRGSGPPSEKSKVIWGFYRNLRLDQHPWKKLPPPLP